MVDDAGSLQDVSRLIAVPRTHGELDQRVATPSPVPAGPVTVAVVDAEGAQHLVAAVHCAAQYRPYTPPALAGALGADPGRGRPALAPRETDVLIEWFQCESKAVVAERLGLSVRTVNSYLDRVRVKYANVGRPAATKATLVARANQDGPVAVEDL